MKKNIPPEPQPRTTIYGKFKGVDFSTDPYNVDRSRSPYSVNLISDKGGQPEKRVGWRILHSIETPVNALAFGYIGQTMVMLAHGGTKLYKWTSSGAVVLKDGLLNAKSVIFFANNGDKTAAYILTGREYLTYDGTTVKNVSESATVPRVIIGGSPSGGGQVLYPVNLLQKKRIEEKAGDGTAKLYQLSTNNLDAATVEITTTDASGNRTTLVEGTHFSVNRQLGQITFTTAPTKPAVTGEDNVFITYSKTVSGYYERITKSAVATNYSVGAANFIFIARNPEHRAKDFWSYPNDPTYFPDTYYSIVGTPNTQIVNYAKLGQSLIVVKESNQQDTSIFIRESFISTVNETQEISFNLKPGITGTGATSPHAFANLIDEPLFLSQTGVYAITSNVITAERTLQNRSFFVDAQLVKEAGLDKAIAIEWNAYYILCINSRCYLLDSRQRSEGKNPSNFYYEAYFWQNVPATCFMVLNNELYFGSADGKICKFNTDVESMARFSDNGQPITAVWSTNMDDDGLPNMTKTMQKKGCLITLKPLTRSGGKIFVKTELDTVEFLIHQAFAGILDWNDIDFNEFSFISNDNARTIVFKKKIKKYWALQFFIVNDSLNQGFGVFNIVKNWVPVNYVKR